MSAAADRRRMYRTLDRLPEGWEWIMDAYMDVRLRDPAGRLFCPLTALCFVETGTYWPNDAWEEAADDLEFDEEAALAIVDAADGLEEDTHPTRAALLRRARAER